MSAILDSMRRHVTSAQEYLRMGEKGIFSPEARLELIEGEIIEMAPIGSLHAGVVNRFNRLLSGLAQDRAIVSVQNPLIVNDRSVPEPDLALLKPRADSYTQSHPTAQDALLVVEVADTTLAFDMGPKAMMYARSGIAEVWVVDVLDCSIRVFRDPSPSGYRMSFTSAHGESVSAQCLPGIVIAVAELFPASQ